MKKFMALYMAPASVIAEMMKMTPDQGKAEMDAWVAWDGKHKAAIVDLGAPLGRTKRVSSSGVSDAHNEVTGYSIVEAESPEAAAKIFADHPHLKMKGTYIDVLDLVDINAMMAA